MSAEHKYKVGLNKEDDVLVDLGTTTRHLILTPYQALELAAYLMKHAKASKKYVAPS